MAFLERDVGLDVRVSGMEPFGIRVEPRFDPSVVFRGHRLSSDQRFFLYVTLSFSASFLNTPWFHHPMHGG
jgi:hypothetical protein